MSHLNGSTSIEEDDVTPIVLTQTETILYFVCLSQGVPINVLVSVVVARNRRLHNPRNTFWFGITMLNLLTMFMSVLKMLAVHSGDYFCLVFTFATGKPYTILLFLLLLATLDRYVGKITSALPGLSECGQADSLFLLSYCT